ncbi:ubiquitin carboxyl-terminal hydrolase 8-like [Patiria miniata]|uniref:ubiquitinyl hydrolase 1 n=1 Tax=Patiria miniata TaxID=46514 RepID=A0A914BLX8_PATMI|nr:ubiquitin carboxyl-terminal hydrolase 8-like [Patiria miniata]XP_038076471.1 ubiquitin carboxyl-terminal hydrolase 8-like [Patiria miniata]XP_038076472.1 ubiquitin carboxyl-terminal hydrolase 8-like [Patiria miniata]
MPVKQKKELYIAKSMQELNLKAQVDTDRNTKIKIYCRSADKMFQEAEKADRNQDEERAYVLYMKFTCLVQYILKAKEYKADKEYYDSLGGIKNVLPAIEKAESLQKSLIKRYEDLKEEEEIKAKFETEDQASQDSVDKPRDANINGEALRQDASLESTDFGQNGAVTACQLYRLFQDSTRKILVIDVRSSEQYKSSHIRNPQVINVPQEVIKPGTTVTLIAKGLSSEVKEMWNMRGSVDCIVMLDWNSTAGDLTKGSTLASLKDALSKWDSTITLKMEPVVLDGGFGSWLLRYPMFTTNPHVTRPPVDSASSTSLHLLDFDYPSLEDDQPKPETKPSPPIQNGPAAKPSISVGRNEQTALSGNDVNSATSSVLSPASSAVSSFKSTPTVNRSSKPKQLNANSYPTNIPSAISMNEDNTMEVAAKVSLSSNKEEHAYRSKISVPSVPDAESPQLSNEKPVIPNRSLKPLVQDDKTKIAGKENGNIEVIAGESNSKKESAIGNQNLMKEVRQVDKADKEEKTGGEGEIARMQREHRIQEQQAKLELEKMRQEKMKTENKQLRLEKAHIEKQLEEKIAALKRMQQELEAQRQQKQSKETVAEDEQHRLQKEEREKKEADGGCDAKPLRLSANQGVKQDVKLQDEALPKLTAKTLDSPVEGDSEPQLQEEIGNHKTSREDTRKPAQPVNKHQQHASSTPVTSMSAPSVPISTPSNTMQISSTGTTSTLPAGWEKKLHLTSNKYYYIDHNTGTTHWSPPTIGPGGAATTATASSTKPVTTVSSEQRLDTRGSGSPSKTSTPSSTTKTRLKSDSSEAPQSNLKRSFSSPNVAQMVINEQEEIPRIPSVNRANKPIQRMPSSSIVQSAQPKILPSVTRARNLNPVYGNQGRSLTGLRNLGNTCFMNSVVQCLSNSTPLTYYFITDKYVPDINRQNPLGRGGNVAQEFAVVIKAIWSGQYRSISPLDLRDTVTKYVPEFRKNIGHHHDSQEFLLFLLDGLHEDLNQVKKREYIKEEELEKYPDQTAAEISWTYHNRLNQSIIVTLFQGQFKSTVCCLSCGHKSVKFEAFMYLSLPLPSSSRCTLQQCLKKFSTEEKLSGDNAIYCSRCKTNRDSAKVILIWKLPRILLIHLKRFYYEGMWRQKLQTMVDFPLHNMDMSPYTRGPKPPKPYYLYAVSNHIGTMDGGHYTACCLNVNNNRWYKFDDHEVHDASQSNIKSAAAYILFYSSMDQLIP